MRKLDEFLFYQLYPIVNRIGWQWACYYSYYFHCECVLFYNVILFISVFWNYKNIGNNKGTNKGIISAVNSADVINATELYAP